MPDDSSPETPRSADIAVILDRSGSMSGIWSEAVGSLQQVVRDQQAIPGPARFTLAAFDSEYRLVHDRVPLASVEHVLPEDIMPRSMTALHDAIGRTVTTLLAEQQKGPKPDATVIAIISDGNENASQEWDAPRVKKLLDRCRADGWTILYFGTDEGQVSTAQKAYGIPQALAVNYAGGAKGMGLASASLGSVLRGTRTCDAFDPVGDQAWRAAVDANTAATTEGTPPKAKVEPSGAKKKPDKQS